MQIIENNTLSFRFQQLHFHARTAQAPLASEDIQQRPSLPLACVPHRIPTTLSTCSRRFRRGRRRPPRTVLARGRALLLSGALQTQNAATTTTKTTTTTTTTTTTPPPRSLKRKAPPPPPLSSRRRRGKTRGSTACTSRGRPPSSGRSPCKS